MDHPSHAVRADTAGLEVSREVIERAKSSYERCCARGPFLHAFYRTFLENCPAARPMFAGTDFERQSRLLQHALGLLLVSAGQPPGSPNLLERVAERHSRRDLDVDPGLYAEFVDSLIETVREHDPEWDDGVGEAWRAAVSRGVAYMQSKY